MPGKVWVDGSNANQVGRGHTVRSPWTRTLPSRAASLWRFRAVRGRGGLRVAGEVINSTSRHLLQGSSNHVDSCVTASSYCERMFDRRSEVSPDGAAPTRCRLPFDIEGVLVSSVSWAGAQFHAVVALDEEEIQRRKELGLGAVTDYLTLKSTSTLPLGAEVPWALVDPIVAAFLDCVPAGVVSLSASGVWCLLRPPLYLIALLKVTSNWRSIGSIAPLAQDAPTVLLMRHRPRELDRAINCAQRIGVGLSYLSGSDFFDVLEPSSTPILGIRRT